MLLSLNKPVAGSKVMDTPSGRLAGMLNVAFDFVQGFERRIVTITAFDSPGFIVSELEESAG